MMVMNVTFSQFKETNIFSSSLQKDIFEKMKILQMKTTQNIISNIISYMSIYNQIYTS